MVCNFYYEPFMNRRVSQREIYYVNHKIGVTVHVALKPLPRPASSVALGFAIFMFVWYTFFFFPNFFFCFFSKEGEMQYEL
jgi:hypothetical protein